MTDEGVCALARGCAELSCLVLSGIQHLTDRSIIALANGCPHIEELYVSGCNMVTRAAIRYLVVRISSYVGYFVFSCRIDELRSFTHLFAHNVKHYCCYFIFNEFLECF